MTRTVLRKLMAAGIGLSSLVLEGGYAMAVLAAVVVLAAIAVPVAWVFYSR